MRKPHKIDRTEDPVSKVARSIQGSSNMSHVEEDWVRSQTKTQAVAMFGERELKDAETKRLHQHVASLASARFGRKIKPSSIKLAVKGGRFQGGKKTTYPVDAGPVIKPVIEGCAETWETTQKDALGMIVRLAHQAGLLPPHLTPG